MPSITSPTTRTLAASLTLLALLAGACSSDDGETELSQPVVSLEEPEDESAGAAEDEERAAAQERAAQEAAEARAADEERAAAQERAAEEAEEGRASEDDDDERAEEEEPEPTDDEDVEAPQDEPARPEAVASTVFDVVGYPEVEIPLLVEISRLERDGDIVRLEFTLTNQSERDSYAPNNSMGATLFDYDVSGVSLVDLTNNLRALVLVDDDDDCVCSDTGGLDLGPGASAGFSATLASPSDVAEVDVQFGDYGIMSSVPVTDR